MSRWDERAAEAILACLSPALSLDVRVDRVRDRPVGATRLVPAAVLESAAHL